MFSPPVPKAPSRRNVIVGRQLSRLIGAIFLSCALVALPAVIGSFGHVNAHDKSVAKVVSPGGYAGLSAKAGSTGSVRIIVGVSGTFAPDPALPHAEAQSQRAAISDAQDSVISELAGKGVSPAGTHKFKYVPYMAMTVDSAGLRALEGSPGVISIEEDIPEPALGTESWNMIKIGAEMLHASAVTGSNVTIAVLDTGVDKNHPYLFGAVVSEACYSSADNDYGIYSLCPQGVSESVEAGSAMPYASGVCPGNKCDHGTHVAGIAAGRSGVIGSPGPGVAPQANIIAVQVFSRLSPRDCPPSVACVGSFPSDQIKGLERILALKDTYTIASVNMSLGGGKYSSTAGCDSANKSRKAIIDSLRAAGIATVIAGGNDGYCGYMEAPGCISSAISVGATDNNDAIADYSNSASFLSLLAPGSDITSSVPEGYTPYDGTSMATPHVAGAWALMRQKYASAGVEDILHAFNATGTSVPGSGKCSEVVKKRINIDDAYHKGILVVTVEGAGKGTVSATNLQCAPGAFTCLGAYTAGAPVTITALPSANSFLDSWSGCDTESGPVCNVAVGSIVNITATFNPPPRISATPATVNFGKIKVAAPYTGKVITVRNTGTSRLVVDSAVIAGSEFSITDNECDSSVSLGKKESCLITIEPAPASATSFGAKHAQLIITSNDPIRPTLAINLNANVAPPKLSVPAALNFSSVVAGTSLVKTIIVRNTGLSDLVIGTVSPAGAQFGTGPTNTCDGQTVAKGDSCAIEVTFTPAPRTTYSGAITIPSNDPVKLTAIVTLKGAGK
jgi:subtilisin family serine protease